MQIGKTNIIYRIIILSVSIFILLLSIGCVGDKPLRSKVRVYLCSADESAVEFRQIEDSLPCPCSVYEERTKIDPNNDTLSLFALYESTIGVDSDDYIQIGYYLPCNRERISGRINRFLVRGWVQRKYVVFNRNDYNTRIQLLSKASQCEIEKPNSSSRESYVFQNPETWIKVIIESDRIIQIMNRDGIICQGDDCVDSSIVIEEPKALPEGVKVRYWGFSVSYLKLARFKPSVLVSME